MAVLVATAGYALSAFVGARRMLPDAIFALLGSGVRDAVSTSPKEDGTGSPASLVRLSYISLHLRSLSCRRTLLRHRCRRRD